MVRGVEALRMRDHPLSEADLEDLRYAKALLENPSLAARVAGALGSPIERGLEMLPTRAGEVIAAATKKSLDAALTFAVATMDERRRDSLDWRHKLAAATSGAVGGAFGLGALAVELPVSTTIMLRSIADIARSEGEPIRTPDSKLACLEVFALGGRQSGDDASESAYFAVRLSLARALGEAAEQLATRGLAGQGSPAVVRFVAQVAMRFGVPVSEKVIAQALPVVGAAGGAVINTLFLDHFQDMARGHFVVRRLERSHGTEVVRRVYQTLPDR